MVFVWMFNLETWFVKCEFAVSKYVNPLITVILKSILEADAVGVNPPIYIYFVMNMFGFSNS